MWQDLAALTPPLVVCVAFLIGLVMFLRREMSPKRRAERAAKRNAEQNSKDRSGEPGSGNIS
jgi:membrane protein insertase Oxa1/YidC/SpoIIIJ